MKFKETMKSVLYQHIDMQKTLVGFRFVWDSYKLNYPEYVDIQVGQIIKRVKISNRMAELISRTTVYAPMSRGWRYQRKQHEKNKSKYP